MSSLISLQKRNNNLKSRLLHEQLKHGLYLFNNRNKDYLLVLNAYKNYRSLFKAAQSVGVDNSLAIKWFLQGQSIDSKFRGFYLAINQFNEFKPIEIIPEIKELKDYEISEFGDAWSYTTEIDGEKVSIISGDLENLKDIVRSRDLPLN